MIKRPKFYTADEKLSIVKRVDEEVAKGRTIDAVANSIGVHKSNYFGWKRRLAEGKSLGNSRPGRKTGESLIASQVPSEVSRQEGVVKVRKKPRLIEIPMQDKSHLSILYINGDSEIVSEVFKNLKSILDK